MIQEIGRRLDNLPIWDEVEDEDKKLQILNDLQNTSLYETSLQQIKSFIFETKISLCINMISIFSLYYFYLPNLSDHFECQSLSSISVISFGFINCVSIFPKLIILIQLIFSLQNSQTQDDIQIRLQKVHLSKFFYYIRNITYAILLHYAFFVLIMLYNWCFGDMCTYEQGLIRWVQAFVGVFLFRMVGSCYSYYKNTQNQGINNSQLNKLHHVKVDESNFYFYQYQPTNNLKSYNIQKIQKISVQENAKFKQKHDDEQEKIQNNNTTTNDHDMNTHFTCTICMMGLDSDTLMDEITILECPSNHYYHSSCVKQWLEYQNKCPLCRSLASKQI